MMSKRKVSIKVRALAGAALFVIATPVGAQTVAPAPARQSVDANGVDLFRGTLNVATSKISMGNSEQGLSYYYLNAGNGWTDNVTAALDQSGSLVTVRLGATTDDFTASGTTYTSVQGRGATLVKSSTTYTYTASDGTIVHFALSKANSAPYYASLGRATDIIDPSGSKLVYDYGSNSYCSRWKPGSGGDICTQRTTMYRLNSITSSYGYAFAFFYQSDDPGDDPEAGMSNVGPWSTVTGMTLNNLTRGGPNQSLPRSFGSNTMTVNGPEGQTTYRTDGTLVYGITRPGSPSENVTVGYASGRVSRVLSV